MQGGGGRQREVGERWREVEEGRGGGGRCRETVGGGGRCREVREVEEGAGRWGK